MGWARLASITSMQKVKHEATVDATSIYNPLLGGGFSKIPIATPVSFDRTSQEFRLTSKADTKFEWLTGLYLNRETGSNIQLVDTTLIGGAAGPQLANVSIPSTYREQAAFGDATWKFTNALSVTGGIRVARNQQTFSQNTTGLLFGGVATSTPGQSKETANTYLLTGRYALDRSSSVYARAATGYRPGGPNAVAPGAVGVPTTFKSDSLTSYEVGYKGDYLDRALSVEAAVYDIRWNDLQQNFVVGGVGVIVNAGKAQVQGVELSTTYRLTPQWKLIGKAAYTDAKFSEGAPGLGAVAGDKLPNSPSFAGSLQLNHTFAVASNPAYVGVGYRYTGERNAGIPGGTSLPSYKMPAYSLVDMQGGVDIGRFNIGMFVRNVFDKRAQLSAYTAFLPLGGNSLVSVAQPRTFGLTVSSSF